MAAQRAAAWPLPFGPYFACHSEKGKKKQAAPMALPAMFYLFIALLRAAFFLRFYLFKPLFSYIHSIAMGII
ncbi:MAG: hypothetical protein ACLSWR_06255 [Ruthenibacterium sp.]